MVHVHHTFSLCFVLFINCTCSVCKFTTIEHHPNEKVRNTDIFCLWPIQVADKYTYHNKKFLNHNISCGVSERATMFYLNNERHFNFSFTNSFGNNGNCYRSGVTWWYSKISNWRKFTILRNRAEVLVSSEVQFSLMRRTRDEWAILLNSTLTSEKL